MSGLEIPERVSRLEIWRKEDRELNEQRYQDVKQKIHKVGNEAASIDEVDYLKKRADGQSQVLTEISTSLKMFDKWSIRMAGLIGTILAGSFALFITFYKPSVSDPEQEIQFQQQTLSALNTLISLQQQAKNTPQKTDQA